MCIKRYRADAKRTCNQETASPEGEFLAADNQDTGKGQLARSSWRKRTELLYRHGSRLQIVKRGLGIQIGKREFKLDRT